MKTPIKLDIEPGAEWLLPAAKRWLEQAKRAMRTPLGAKVFDLPSGEKVTVQWRQGLDYVRISSGGQIIVGYSLPAPNRPQYWGAGEKTTEINMLTGMTTAFARDVSADRKTIVGYGFAPAAIGWRWTKSEGMIGLESPVLGRQSVAVGVSGDGNIIVGYVPGTSSLPAVPWKWNSGVYSYLAALPADAGGAVASAISEDGTVVVGFSARALTASVVDSYRAVRWDASAGVIDLGYPTSDYNNSVAEDVSSNGGVIVGRSFHWEFSGPTIIETIESAWKWTAEDGMILLPNPPGRVESTAESVSRDGGTIVGSALSTINRRAVVWDESGVTELGVLPGSTDADSSKATGVSPDGKTIVGVCVELGKTRPVIWHSRAVATPLEILPGATGGEVFGVA